MDIIQKITLEVLERLEERPRHASEEIARAFHKAKRLFPNERAAIVERTHGILRSVRFLDYAIDQAGPVPEEGSPRRRARWYAHEVIERRIRPSEAAREMPKVDWVRVVEAPAWISRIPDPLRRLAISESLPDWLVRRIVDEYGETEAFELARAWNEPAPLTLRANRLRTERNELIETFLGHGLEVRATERARDGLVLLSKRNVFRSPEFQDGLFEVQDEGSQLVSELVAPPPGGTVLDACAGSGGKTLHLGALLGGKGRVVAVGVGPVGVRQLEELERRAKRAGLRNVQTVRMGEDGEDGAEPAGLPGKIDDTAAIDPANWPPPLAKQLGRVDRVLVDAPCSGLGVLRRNPEARDRITPETVTRLASLQRAILERFAPFVKPGGRLIYATCSVLREENDDVVEAFLQAHPEFRIMPVKEILGKARAMEIGDGERLRLLPHRQGTDGFFAVVLRRTAG